MNAKVVRLVALMEEGYDIRRVEPDGAGGLRLRVASSDRAEVLSFAFYEVPAIHQATRVVGVGG